MSIQAERVKVTCKNCGVSELVAPWYISHRNKHGKGYQFCSQKCNGAWKSKHAVGPLRLSCQRCQSPFTSYPSRLKSNRGKYCSKLCRDVARKNIPITYKNGRHSSWRGGRAKIKHGYIGVYYEPEPGTGRHWYRAEHRLIMEQVLGRKLGQKEVVHHINGRKEDNRPENLMVLASQSEHMAYHRVRKPHTQRNRELV